MGNGPVIRNPTPSWLRPENASVFDSGVEKALRMLARLIGADDPTGQVMGIAAPVDVPGGATSPVVKAIEAIAGKAKKGFKAFHGSPHDFDKFSLSKIGTGEGAQAYGHGLYFTETPEVARNYRDMVPATDKGVGAVLDTDMRIGGRLVTDVYSEIERKAGRLSPKDAAPVYEQLSALEALMQHGDMLGVNEAASAGQVTPEALAWMKKEVFPKFTRKGKLMEVSINADPEDFLDWDAPLSQQSEKVRQSLNTDYGGLRQSVREEVNGPGYFSEPLRERVSGEVRTGQRLYRDLRNTAGTDAELTERLKQAGIPGIKYLDGASRSAGQGSRNFVVFDDALIEIRRKYGFMLPIMGAAGFEQWSRQKAMEETGAHPIDALAERKW